MIWDDKALQDHLVPTDLLGKGHVPLDQVAQIPIQAGLEYRQGLSTMAFPVLKRAVHGNLTDCAAQTVTWNECHDIIHTDNWQVLNAQESFCWSYFWKKLASDLLATYFLCQTKPAILAIVPQPLAPANAVASKWSGAHCCLVAAQGSYPAEIQPHHQRLNTEEEQTWLQDLSNITELAVARGGGKAQKQEQLCRVRSTLILFPCASC